ncbi:uncharacterized protein LOC110269200 [Arachis ipaensis]|uniref:uncharacterized protein LOC110269200 n=1 Tax=Arachis ipaensis TaxID=130454 RepID=UPI000A2B0DD6|nr:uncharacterized protein LOC110269200 [Arachis ipaensis]
MREEEPSPNASSPLEELRSSPPPWRGKRRCSLASHRRASWLPMREPREPLQLLRNRSFTDSTRKGTGGRREPMVPSSSLRTRLVAGCKHSKSLKKGAITKRMTAIEEMAGMDVLCSDKTGTLTLNKLTVNKNLIEVFADGVNQDMVVLMAARASRLENQDAIDCAIVSMLADPKKVLFQLPTWLLLWIIFESFEKLKNKTDALLTTSGRFYLQKFVSGINCL